MDTDWEEVKITCNKDGILFAVWEDGFWSLLKVDSKGYLHAESVPTNE